MAPAGEFTKGLWSGKLKFLIANFKLKDVSTYHAAAVCTISFGFSNFLNICTDSHHNMGTQFKLDQHLQV